MRRNGEGKLWYDDGNIGIIKFENDKEVEKKKYLLLGDGTHILFEKDREE